MTGPLSLGNHDGEVDVMNMQNREFEDEENESRIYGEEPPSGRSSMENGE